MPEPQRLEMCRNALAASRQAADKKLVLDVLKLYPTIASLKLAVEAAQIPELKEDAAQAALAIAPRSGGKVDELLTILAKLSLNEVNLEIVKAEYGAGATQQDVTEVLRQQNAQVQLIPLAAGYNATFGGDPAPGTPKKLKVLYRIDGRQGEASFAEDALIALPLPK
jgi:hypothetical protein